MKITNPELKVVRFNAEDVIATSLYAFANGNGGYDIYEGTMGAYDANAGAWSVNLGDYVKSVSGEDFDDYSRNFAYSYIHSLYGAYSNGTSYYTKGATYAELYGEFTYVEGPGASGFPDNPPPIPFG